MGRGSVLHSIGSSNKDGDGTAGRRILNKLSGEMDSYLVSSSIRSVSRTFSDLTPSRSVFMASISCINFSHFSTCCSFNSCKHNQTRYHSYLLKPSAIFHTSINTVKSRYNELLATMLGVHYNETLS